MGASIFFTTGMIRLLGGRNGNLCLKARIAAAVKNINAPMLTRVLQELEYRIDVCRVNRGAHIEHSSCQIFSAFLWL
jgi:hypothetical protein